MKSFLTSPAGLISQQKGARSSQTAAPKKQAEHGQGARLAQAQRGGDLQVIPELLVMFVCGWTIVFRRISGNQILLAELTSNICR